MRLFKIRFEAPPLTIKKYVIANSFGDAETRAIEEVQKEYSEVKQHHIKSAEVITSEDNLIHATWVEQHIPGTKFTPIEALRRAIKSAAPYDYDECDRWVAVKRMLSCGSSYAKNICKHFGLDPDETVSRNRQYKPYLQLIQAVQTKHEGESRHETALRYIHSAEAHAYKNPQKESE